MHSATLARTFAKIATLPKIMLTQMRYSENQLNLMLLERHSTNNNECLFMPFQNKEDSILDTNEVDLLEGLIKKFGIECMTIILVGSCKASILELRKKYRNLHQMPN